MEVASASTGRNDYTEKRITYANLGVPEYWRFDYTGGAYHDAPLVGDRLSDTGVYRPIGMITEADGVIWGYSEVLGLSLCWVEGRLRFWARAQGQYLPDLPESEARADAEAQARADAEAYAASESARADAESARAAAAESPRPNAGAGTAPPRQPLTPTNQAASSPACRPSRPRPIIPPTRPSAQRGMI